MTTPDQDLTAMIVEARSGDGRAADVLLEAIYGRLRAMAEEKLKGERPGHTLQATALVHEAYLKLVDQSRVELNCRSHFCAVAAQAMRRILVDHARGKQRAKRGGAYHGVTLDDAHALSASRDRLSRAERRDREDPPRRHPASRSRRDQALRRPDDGRSGAHARHAQTHGRTRMEDGRRHVAA